MKVSLLIAAILAVPLAAQRPAGPKLVPLDTVMACQNDVLLRNVFSLKASDLPKLEQSSSGRPNLLFEEQTAKFYGFTVIYSPGGEWLVVSQDTTQSFCHNSVHVSIFKKLDSLADTISDSASYPAEVSVLAGDLTQWRLDINEVFKHADQFRFDSGVFDDSTEVYVTATKGRVHIQFVFEAGALRLYRVTYDSDRRLK